MLFLKFHWLCKIIGHHFTLVKDLRGTLKRERVVYRCLRCNLPLVARLAERRQTERRGAEGRKILSDSYDRRNGERRDIYNSHHNLPHLLHDSFNTK